MKKHLETILVVFSFALLLAGLFFAQSNHHASIKDKSAKDSCFVKTDTTKR